MIRVATACVVGAVVSAVLVAQTPSSSSRAAAREVDEEAYRQNNIGVARLEQYDYASAVAAFRRALQQRPNLASARVNLGIALLYDGQLEAAAKEVQITATQRRGSAA